MLVKSEPAQEASEPHLTNSQKRGPRSFAGAGGVLGVTWRNHEGDAGVPGVSSVPASQPRIKSRPSAEPLGA